jgi:hypothetical protein
MADHYINASSFVSTTPLKSRFTWPHQALALLAEHAVFFLLDQQWLIHGQLFAYPYIYSVHGGIWSCEELSFPMSSVDLRLNLSTLSRSRAPLLRRLQRLKRQSPLHSSFLLCLPHLIVPQGLSSLSRTLPALSQDGLYPLFIHPRILEESPPAIQG